MDKNIINLEHGTSDNALIFGEKQFNFFPSVGLKMTGACRISCPFCCEPKRNQKVFPIDNFLKITTIINQLGTKRICFTGGDPLLYPDLPQLLNHTKTLGFYNLILTGDGEMLQKDCEKISPYIDAVRFSIHNIGALHDDIVNYPGAFDDMEKAIDLLTKKNVPCCVTTVVTPLNFGSIFNIAEWCFRKNIQTYFLFGLMRSGKGKSFIDQHGAVSEKELSKSITMLKQKYSPKQLEIVHYEYKKNAECILIYGDGKVVIDPYPSPPSFQLEIGNILSETPAEIRCYVACPLSQITGYGCTFRALVF